MVRYGPITIDHHRYEIPPAFLAEMIVGHVEEDIFDYKYAVIDDPELHSAWLLRFFQRVPFFCLVFQSIEARHRIEMAAGDYDNSSLVYDNPS